MATIVRAAGRRLALAAPWAFAALVVAVLAAFATVGVLRRRFEADPSGDYPLFTQLAAAAPWLSIGVFLGAAAAYAAAIALIRLLARRAVRAGDATGSPWARTIAWVYRSWWRIALVLAVLWSPWFVMRWPGAVNPDFALMVTEIAMTRSEFAPGAIPPYDVYPIAHALIPDGETVWSNQHNAFLTLAYGVVAGASGAVFHSYVPGIVLLSSTQALFTLFALGRALQLVGRSAPRTWVRTAALAVTAAAIAIPLWSMDLSKNPLFAAASVWWLALLIERTLSGTRRRLWAWELAISTTLIIVSAKFGVYIALVGAVMLLVQRLGWRAIVAAMIAPIAVVQVALQALMGLGILIPDDPIEARVVQLQQIALILREDPDAVSAADRAVLERVFDTEAMARVYVPDSADPVKSSGFGDNGSYRWQTVRPEDWDGFTGVWLDLAAARPDLFVDAFLLKTDRFLDPVAEVWPLPPTAPMDWTVSYSLDLTDVGAPGRAALEAIGQGVYRTPAALPFSASAWTVVTVLLCVAAITLRRRGAWVWSLPLALQVGVALLSPLNGSGRYLLGLMYAAGLVLLALGAVPRPAARHAHTDTSERMAQ